MDDAFENMDQNIVWSPEDQLEFMLSVYKKSYEFIKDFHPQDSSKEHKDFAQFVMSLFSS